MDSQLAGTAVTVLGSIVCQAITAYAAIRVALAKSAEVKTPEEKPDRHLPPEKREVSPPSPASPSNAQFKFGVIVLFAMPLLLGLEYYALYRSMPTAWAASVLTAITAVVLMSIVLLSGVSSSRQIVEFLDRTGLRDRGQQRMRVSGWGALFSAILSLFLIYLYDAGLFPLTREANFTIVTRERALGRAFQNNTDRTMLVTVSAQRTPEAGFTMFAAVSDEKGGVDPRSDAATVAAASFAAPTHNSSITFLVPRKFWYSVSTNAPSNVIVSVWTEALM
ncbi:hypothetical protein [Bradyrhizobium sp. HKCCYLS20291]|uniref:hypothetical protein n=1 Tax=Bradyrhizobium sp. HKCCYLS20291 TaxID=3420766 RepID=UPI003EBF5771